MKDHKGSFLWILSAAFIATVIFGVAAVSSAATQEAKPLSTKAHHTESEKELNLEVMIVTAQKQEESVLDVPANVTVIDGFTMQDLGIDKIDELTELSPNINIDKADSHMTQVVFRGIGGVTNMNKAWNTTVDGVTVPYVGVDMFLDVDRVELMRGSQGSLYGRNTHAGMINVITRKPTDEFSLDTSVEVESYNTQKYKAAFGGPVANNQGYRLAFGYSRTDGFMDNDFLDSDDGNRHEQFSGRATYEIETSSSNLLRLTLTGDTYNGGFDAYTPISRGTRNDTINSNEGLNKGHLISPTLTWEKNFAHFSLTSITNYSDSNYQFGLDQDFGPMDLMNIGGEEDYRTFTQEIRFSGNASSNLEWLAGLFLMVEEIDILTDFSFGNDAGLIMMPAGLHMIADSSIETEGAALFGQVILHLLPQLELRARLRLDYEQREMSWQGQTEMSGMTVAPSVDFSREDDWFGVMPSASLAYLLSDRQQIYLSVDRGYKAGDYAANQVDIDAVREAVDPEYTLTYEVGYKGLLADKRLAINAAAFYIDWTDMQVSVVQNNIALMQNAAEANSYGVELEARWQAAHGLDLLVGLGWMKAEFDNYDNHPSGEDQAGNKLPNANEYSFSLGVRYRHDNGFFASVSAAHMGPKYLDEENRFKQNSYTLVNAKLGYEALSWAVYLYGRNLLDEDYLVHSFTNAARCGEPAIIGAQINYIF